MIEQDYIDAINKLTETVKELETETQNNKAAILQLQMILATPPKKQRTTGRI